MRNALALMSAAALAAITAATAQAGERWPVIPYEIGAAPAGSIGWVPYRCSDWPAHNFYHGAVYYEPPALDRGYAYRPYYRYTAYRVTPRTYLCARREW
jgi:hypothetical protein